jgi:hypothetical protein
MKQTPEKRNCEWCGDPAAFWDTRNEEPSCEDCARYHAAHDAGESYAVGQMLAASIDYMKATASEDEIRQALDAILRGAEPMLGETKRELVAFRGAEERVKTAHLWRGRFEPLADQARAER